MEAKRTGAESRACSILARLADQLSDARVEYQCRMELHEFTVHCGESRFAVRFTEQMLLRRSIEDSAAKGEQIMNGSGQAHHHRRLRASVFALPDRRSGRRADAGPHSKKQNNDARLPQ